MAAPHYRFLLVNPGGTTWHMLNVGNDPILAELDVQQGQWEWGINKAGTATLEVSKENLRLANRDRAGTSEEIVRRPRWKNTIPPMATTLWIERNGRPIWAGFVMEFAASGDSTTVQIVAEEFVGYYERLRLTNVLATNGTTQQVMSIISSLLAAEDYTSMQMELRQFSPKHASPFIFADKLEPYLTPGTDIPLNTTTYVPLWYEHEDHKILDLINTMRAAVTPTFEWRQGIERWNGEAGRWHAKFTTYHNRMGSSRRFEPILAWGEGTAMNVKSMNWRYSARQMGTRITVYGNGAGDSRVLRRRYNVKNYSNAVNTPTGLVNGVQVYDIGAPLIDLSYSDEKLRTQGHVDSRATRLIDVFSQPQLNVDVEIDPSNPAFRAVIDTAYDDTDPFYEVDGPVSLGDRLSIHLVDGPLSLSDELRLMSMAMRFQAGGDETVLLSLAPDTVNPL